MNPQILGNLTALAQKVQQANQTALVAQSAAVSAQQTASAATSAVSSLASSVGPLAGFIKILATPVTYTKADLTLDDNWYQLSVPGVPGSAQWMYVGGYVTNQGSTGGGNDNARQKMSLSPNAGISIYVVSYSNGVASSYENDAPIGPCLVPCVGSIIWYRWSAGVTDTNFIIYGHI